MVTGSKNPSYSKNMKSPKKSDCFNTNRTLVAPYVAKISPSRFLWRIGEECNRNVGWCNQTGLPSWESHATMVTTVLINHHHQLDGDGWGTDDDTHHMITAHPSAPKKEQFPTAACDWAEHKYIYRDDQHWFNPIMTSTQPSPKHKTIDLDMYIAIDIREVIKKLLGFFEN